MKKDRSYEISKQEVEAELDARMQGSNRRSKRVLSRVKKAGGLKVSSGALIHEPAPLAEILDNEDDLVMLGRELVIQEALQAQLTLRRQMFNVYRSCNVSEPTARQVIFSHNNSDPTLIARMMEEASSQKMNQSRVVMSTLRSKLGKVPVVYVDSDERDLTTMMRESEFPADEIFSEASRVRSESIGLLRMQIAWVTEKGPKTDPDLTQKPLPGTEISHGVIQADANGIDPSFALADWLVYFSEKPWATSESHLRLIPTTSQEEAEKTIEQATRRYRSIKPSSIINALSHHLFDKDVIQRALSTRFRYAPEEERDWVKAKRGKDRLGFLIDEDDKKVIFCIEGRDTVYRR